MFASLASSRNLLDDVARTFDASSLSAEAALRAVDELGAIRRVVDGMLAKAAKRIEETHAHVRAGERNAATLVARTISVGTDEVRAAIETASKLERLPSTDAAVRGGRLSARAAQMIAETATANPARKRSCWHRRRVAWFRFGMPVSPHARRWKITRRGRSGSERFGNGTPGRIPTG